VRLKKRAIVLLGITVVVAAFFITSRIRPPEVVYVAFDTAQPVHQPSAIPLVPRYRSQINDTGYLKLVNRQLAVNSPIDPSQMVDAWPTVPVRATDITLHPTALNAVSALFYEGQDVGSFFVTSGFRDFYRQQELYVEAYNHLYVLPAGHSEHQLGLAADILIMGVPMDQMSGRADTLWLQQNAWRHGLIHRYPYDMTHITGVAYEPWHFRYVGRVHAWYMHEHRMVLEEYLEHLEANEHISVAIDGVIYHVLYQRFAGVQLYVPQNMEFIVSASNRGGYVITAWEKNGHFARPGGSFARLCIAGYGAEPHWNGVIVCITF